MPYAKISNETRHRIIEAYNKGSSISLISTILNYNRTTISKIIKRYVSTGSFIKKTRTSFREKKLSTEQVTLVRQWIDENCTLTLRAISNRCSEEFGVTVSTSTIATVIKEFAYSLKRVHLVPQRRNVEEVVEKRFLYAQNYISMQYTYSESKIVFVDEVGFNVSMRASRGRSAIGTPATLTVPAVRTRNISICCSINRESVILYESRISAYSSIHFCNYLINLFTTLRSKGMYDVILIMDNVGFHKTDEVKNLIETSGFAFMYLPPYSPFLNPIENMFSKWKEHVRRTNPTNEQTLMRTIEDGANLISSEDTDGYFRNMLSYIPRCLNRDEIPD
jgi:transposase